MQALEDNDESQIEAHSTRQKVLKIVLHSLGATLVMIYPLLLWLGTQYISPRTISAASLLLVAIWLLRARSKGSVLGNIWLIPLTIGLLLIAASLSNSETIAKLIPVGINTVLLFFFFSSLFSERPMIERFARLQIDTLNEHQKTHCRQFTWAWCGFFSLNIVLLTYFALSASTFWWSTYASAFNYILMGALFTAEFLVRRYRFREYSGRFYDRWLTKIWPTLPTSNSHDL